MIDNVTRANCRTPEVQQKETLGTTSTYGTFIPQAQADGLTCPWQERAMVTPGVYCLYRCWTLGGRDIGQSMPMDSAKMRCRLHTAEAPGKLGNLRNAIE